MTAANVTVVRGPYDHAYKTSSTWPIIILHSSPARLVFISFFFSARGSLFLFHDCNNPASFPFNPFLHFPFSSFTVMLGKFFTVVVMASTAFAHSNMLAPAPRENRSNAFVNINNNGCENTKTDVPGQNNFARGQKVPLECELGFMCI